MAAGSQVCCSNCSFNVEAWDDGNPYIVDQSGERQHCYHPAAEDIIMEVRAFISVADPDALHKDAGRMGNESDLLCLDCGHSSRLDSDVDTLTCAKCGGKKLRDHMELDGAACPKCGKGTLEISGPMMVS
jgi:DNA-directed RNA polymerase subunit RPC12/RpoP